MTVEDKLAIQEAIARYSYAYGSKDAEAFAQLFVEDGVFEVTVLGTSSQQSICGPETRERAPHRTVLSTC
jgi:uncharacterized protein (TIGR02246 family)